MSEFAKLRERAEAAEREVERWRAKERRRRERGHRVGRWVRKATAWLFWGRSLENSFKVVVGRASRREAPTGDEVSLLAAALTRRFLRVSAVFIAVTLLAQSIMVAQLWMMHKANRISAASSEANDRSMEQQLREVRDQSTIISESMADAINELNKQSEAMVSVAQNLAVAMRYEVAGYRRELASQNEQNAKMISAFNDALTAFEIAVLEVPDMAPDESLPCLCDDLTGDIDTSLALLIDSGVLSEEARGKAESIAFRTDSSWNPPHRFEFDQLLDHIRQERAVVPDVKSVPIAQPELFPLRPLE